MGGSWCPGRDHHRGAVSSAGQVVQHHPEAVAEGHRDAYPVLSGVRVGVADEQTVVQRCCDGSRWRPWESQWWHIGCRWPRGRDASRVLTTGSLGGVTARQRPKKEMPRPGPEPLQLNQTVAYDLRDARERRGWTKAHSLELQADALGPRVTASTVSSLERAWDGDRRRQVDVHELAHHAVVLDVSILRFFLRPPGCRGKVEGIDRSLLDLYGLVVGRNDQFESMVERLCAFGVYGPTPEAETLEKITGRPSHNRHGSFCERREELLLAGAGRTHGRSRESGSE